MALISDRDRAALIEAFSELERNVTLNLKTGPECPTCEDTRRLVEEVAGLSPHISLRLVEDGLPGDLLPELEICPQEPEPRERGIVYLGIPSGYEFSSLVQDILMAGHGDSGLNQTTREALEKLAEPVRIQVFVTPTCPYCPGAVHLAHQMAYQSDLVQAEMIEAMEFPELAQKFGVMGVPRTVINDRQHVEGAAPEAVLLEQVLAAVGSPERDLLDA